MNTVVMVRALQGRAEPGEPVHAVDTVGGELPPVFPPLCGRVRLRRMHVEVLPLAFDGRVCDACMLLLPEWPQVEPGDEPVRMVRDVPGATYAAPLNTEPIRHIVGAADGTYVHHGRVIGLAECGFMIFDPDRNDPSLRPSSWWPLCAECADIRGDTPGDTPVMIVDGGRTQEPSG